MTWRTLATVNDPARRSVKAGITTHFARWYLPFILVVCVSLVLIGTWSSAAGVVVGAATFLLKTRRVRYAMRSPLEGAHQHSGLFIYAAFQGMVGGVCLFVGALFTNHVVRFFSAAFGTWQLSMAVFLGVVIRAARQSERDNQTS